MEGNYNQPKDMVKIGKNSVDINHTCIFTLVYIDTNTWKRILHTAVTAVKTQFQESPGLAFHAHKGTDSSSLKRVVTGNPHRDSQKGQVDSCKSALFDVAIFGCYIMLSLPKCAESP